MHLAFLLIRFLGQVVSNIFLAVSLGPKEVLQSLDMSADFISFKYNFTLGINCICKFYPIRVVSPLPEEVSHPRTEDMPEHPREMLLFKVLFMSTDSQL